MHCMDKHNVKEMVCMYISYNITNDQNNASLLVAIPGGKTGVAFLPVVHIT